MGFLHYLLTKIKFGWQPRGETLTDRSVDSANGGGKLTNVWALLYSGEGLCLGCKWRVEASKGRHLDPTWILLKPSREGSPSEW